MATLLWGVATIIFAALSISLSVAMPTYQYKCTECEEVLEVQQSFDDDPLETADGCTENESSMHTLKKVFGSVGIAFKGSGFYANDTRGGSSSSSGGSSSDSKSA